LELDGVDCEEYVGLIITSPSPSGRGFTLLLAYCVFSSVNRVQNNLQPAADARD